MGSEETTPEKIEDDFEIPKMPSEDWEMTVFLNKLSDELTSEDLKKMKSLLNGMYKTGIRVLEEIKDPLDFFQHLRHRRILTRDNIIMLQTLIWHINRRDLHLKIVEFSSNLGNVVHFYHTEDKPLNGFEFVQFHVAGKEKMNRHKLEELRSLVAKLVCVSPDCILTAGIEATNSVFVTFMIPEGYSNVLINMDQSEKDYLGSKGVDTIVIDGQTIRCTDQPYKEEGIVKDDEIKILLDQKSKHEKEIEDQQILLLEKDRQIKQYESLMEDMKARTKWHKFEVTSRLVEEYIGIQHTPDNLALRVLAAKKAERALQDRLRIAENLGYDRKFLQHLLEANTLCITSQQTSLHGAIQANLYSRIKTLQTQIATLAYERDKLAYFVQGDISKPVLTQNEEFFLKVLSLPSPFPVGKVIITNEYDKLDSDTLETAVREVLTKMESYLDEDQRDILKRTFLGSDDNLKVYKDSKLLLLEHLWKCEQEKKGQIGADFHGWMVTVLATIKRMGLLDEWIRIGKEVFERALSRSIGKDQKFQVHKEKKEMSGQASCDSTERGGSGSKKDRKKRDSGKSNAASVNVTEARIEKFEETLKEMRDLLKENTQVRNSYLEALNMNRDQEIKYDWRKLSHGKFFYENKML